MNGKRGEERNHHFSTMAYTRDYLKQLPQIMRTIYIEKYCEELVLRILYDAKCGKGKSILSPQYLENHGNSIHGRQIPPWETTKPSVDEIMLYLKKQFPDSAVIYKNGSIHIEWEFDIPGNTSNS